MVGSGRVREAGWTYLVASHLGTAFLLPVFALLGRGAGSLDFAAMHALHHLSPTIANLVFVLALVGFGTKAGWVPFHVWLPQAHPAAPSHVSALMSGVLVKLGIYGLLRTLWFMAPYETTWWGWLLIAVGAASGLYGILYALAQTDLKRMLAYSTVENTGLSAMGLGLGIVGQTSGHARMAWLGFAGALLHVLNHAFFKGLLFLGAGAVLHATGTTEMDRLGGLARRMPWTAALFLTGAAAISALPPLNGFVSEVLILLAAFNGLASAEPLAGLTVIASIALIAGLAGMAFARASGVVFLGEARDPGVRVAAEPPFAMRGAMFFLAAVLVVLGITLPWALSRASIDIQAAMQRLALGLAGFVALLVLAALARRRLLFGREVGSAPTWGCGYSRPTPRMQYTASSFADPLLSLFTPLVNRRSRLGSPQGAFPRAASLELATVDPVGNALYASVYAALRRGLGWFRWLQQGRVQLYVLYIAATLVALLLWARSCPP